jgi:hypothetical protein
LRPQQAIGLDNQRSDDGQASGYQARRIPALGPPQNLRASSELSGNRPETA